MTKTQIIMSRNMDKIKRIVYNHFPSDKIEFRTSIDDRIFFYNYRWKTFKDVEKDLDFLSYKMKIEKNSICFYDLNKNIVYTSLFKEGITDDIDKILNESGCVEFYPEIERGYLDDYQEKNYPEYTGEKLDEYLNGDFSKSWTSIGINDEKQNFGFMMHKYNNLKENQTLYYVNVDGCHDYNHWCIMETSDLKMKDVEDCYCRIGDEINDGFNLQVGILISN